MANLTVLQDGSERIHYSNPFIPIYACRGNLRGLSGMAALCHWHEEVEFLLPFKGHLYYNINGARLLIPQGRRRLCQQPEPALRLFRRGDGL